MSPTAAQSLRWMAGGHQYFLAQLKLNRDEELEGPSRLPGWTGRHLLSHLGHNARALGRLTHWAATGEPTPMYPSPEARAEEIEEGATWPVARLRAFVEAEQERLAADLGGFTDTVWQAEVVTAQGRTVPASTIPWLRAREVWIHACDLPTGGEFADFPEDFLGALIDDARTRRRTAQGIDVTVRLTGRPAAPDRPGAPYDPVEGSADALARWLTGRGTSPSLRTVSGKPLPELPPWL
ncbi:maleylpyruvate isomerase family mycothiol-dependent enzyme [Streptomyces sp. NPDC090088]|uniref:maleylpyruvate isomerase family mycothiol-dependent enzyme n=1 Tax=Streptomyces sp. NPDC090088 TaxID=3365944 RepID=UPI0037F95EB6